MKKLRAHKCSELVRFLLVLCVFGFHGIHCQVNNDDCANSNCSNGSTCRDGINTYTCECPPTHTGTFCETDVNECLVMPGICKNGATCMNTPDFDYTCICVNGWAGQDCSINIDDCQTQPCLHNGTCHDHVGYFTCTCQPDKTGFTGDRCEHDIDECAGINCHYGNCVDLQGNYRCDCYRGYTGKHCDMDIDECEASPCQYGGTCVQLRDGGGYDCQCPLGTSGLNCEKNHNECANNPCLNDGICQDGIHSYSCTCEPGYTGKNPSFIKTSGASGVTAKGIRYKTDMSEI